MLPHKMNALHFFQLVQVPLEDHLKIMRNPLVSSAQMTEILSAYEMYGAEDQKL